MYDEIQFNSMRQLEEAVIYVLFLILAFRFVKICIDIMARL